MSGNELRRSRVQFDCSLGEGNQLAKMLPHFCFRVVEIHVFSIVTKFISESCVEGLVNVWEAWMGCRCYAGLFSANEFIDPPRGS